MKFFALILTFLCFTACITTPKTIPEDLNFNEGWLFAKDSIIGAEKISFDDLLVINTMHVLGDYLYTEQLGIANILL